MEIGIISAITHWLDVNFASLPLNFDYFSNIIA